MFKPIRTEQDLPKELVSHETFELDFKRDSATANAVELAKDVAAFANNLGGVILVGAVEDKTNRRLGFYKPLSESNVASIKEAYEVAVRDRCYPKPMTDVQPVAKDEGFVLAVNVWSFPAQPIGVRSEKPNAYFFPLRTGTHTTFLSPDQLPMLTLPDLRRVAILLSSIPTDKRHSITLVSAQTGPSIPCHTVILVDPTTEQVTMKNTVRFKMQSSDVEFTVPADSITHVWESQARNWVISTSVGLIERDGGLIAAPQ